MFWWSSSKLGCIRLDVWLFCPNIVISIWVMNNISHSQPCTVWYTCHFRIYLGSRMGGIRTVGSQVFKFKSIWSTIELLQGCTRRMNVWSLCLLFFVSPNQGKGLNWTIEDVMASLKRSQNGKQRMQRRNKFSFATARYISFTSRLLFFIFNVLRR